MRLALLLTLGLAPWPGVREQSNAAFRGLANLVLQRAKFGDGSGLGQGSAQLMPIERRAATGADDGPAWDTRLRLRVSGVSEVKDVVVSPRRMAFVPCWVLLSIVLASPLALRRKLGCLLAGVPLLLAWAVSSIATTAAWIFSQVPGLVYGGTPVHRTAVELAYRALVVPTSNRFILPLLLGVALVAWQHPWGERRTVTAR
ncbi:MAG: hypothetical protein ACHQ53_10935 [Polyangiales bacterium]